MSFTPIRIRFASLVIALFVSNALSGGARAVVIGLAEPPTFTLAVDGFGPTWTYSPALDVLEDLPGRGKKLGVAIAMEHILGNRASVVIDKLEYDPDPFVLNNILITNTTGTTQIYTVGIALPTTFPGPNLISGNVRTDVIDGGGAPGGMIATVAGFPVYTAQIDFTTVTTLQNAPFSVIAPPAGSSSSAAAFGPNINAMAVSSNIGIQLRFSLTPGDTASILSRFDVSAVPEPSSVLLAMFGVVTGVFACRRQLRRL